MKNRNDSQYHMPWGKHIQCAHGEDNHNNTHQLFFHNIMVLVYTYNKCLNILHFCYIFRPQRLTCANNNWNNDVNYNQT